MAITFACACGKSYSVADEMAGKRTKCPACHAVLVVPIPTAVDEPLADLDVVEDVEEEDTSTGYGLADEAGPAVDDVPDMVDEAEVEDEEEEEDSEADGSPEYFVAVYPPAVTVLQPKTFRFYPDRDDLLVLHAGPFSWGLVATLSDRPGVREQGRTGAVHGGNAGAAGALMGAASDAFARKGLAKRAAVLDRMTLDELRAEADADKNSFRITADNTSKAKVEPPSSSFGADRAKEQMIAGRLKFTHAKAGKWELVLLNRTDARLAIRSMRRVLGPESVDVTLRFKKERE
jgi:hypothetical protein